MMIKYSRETAVKEGLRKSVEIDKGFFKRPAMMVTKAGLEWGAEKETLKKKIDRYLDIVTRVENGDIKTTLPNFWGALKTATPKRVKKMLGESIGDKYEKEIRIKEAIELENFKGKTINCIVEKQYNNIYTLRDARSRKGEVYEIKLDRFVNIVGRDIYMNLDKKDGNFIVKEILITN